ncbi:CU044_5270 family protein [Streptomyces zagrosensis]|uniref:CU044_5270 family protein n=1 Tax=Streptomyces zagrosensis TaxID=1042984 RepID=A0A7W9V0D1_9ACTN|nr:CU044_5270 family protein [Streptomyces zagrosensis]MBB5938025.1 hypothetical protein [Streptomyces zagrosensis]
MTEIHQGQGTAREDDAAELTGAAEPTGAAGRPADPERAEPAAEPAPEPATEPATAPSGTPPAGQPPSLAQSLGARLLSPEWTGPAVAIAMVITVIIVIVRSTTDSSGSQRPARLQHIEGPAASSTFAPGAHGGGDEKGGAPELLAHIATAAEKKPDIRPRDGEFTYVRSKRAALPDSTDEALCTGIEPLRQRQIWRSVDGSQAGLLRSEQFPGERIRLNPDAPNPTSTAYRHLQHLPNDPATLLRTLYAVTLAGRPNDQQVFRSVGGMLTESVLPPATEAALYRAAARIPGVVVIKDAVDAVGRHGTAVARFDDTSGEREEWIFDRKTRHLLGVRVVTVDPEKAPGTARENCAGLRAGVVTSTTAVVERGIAARAGDRPRGS